MEEKIVKILNEMSEYLSIAQMKKLQEVILKVCSENEADKVQISNHDFLEMFLECQEDRRLFRKDITILQSNSSSSSLTDRELCKKSDNRGNQGVFSRVSEEQQLFKCYN